MKDKLGLLPKYKRQRFLQIAIMNLGMWHARHAEITQNNKFAISFQCPKKELSH